jgi:hypothetical protein
MICLRIHHLELHGQEHLLLEPHIGNELAHVIISLLKSLPFGVSQPHHKCLPGVHFLLSLHYGEHEILLRFLFEANVPPMADVSS